MRVFYEEYFGAKANNKYINRQRNFESYFLTFDSGARLELMYMPTVVNGKSNIEHQPIGLTHIAFSAGSREKVQELTERLRQAGHSIVSEPRTTGDGYYESCVRDPDGNYVEITE